MELVISMTILQVAILALVAALSSGHTAVLRAGKVSTAAALASKELETYRAMSYGDLEFAVATNSKTEEGPDGRTYIVDTTITEEESLQLKVVVVTVREPNSPSALVRQRTEYSHLTGW
jgi:exosome complex RNA-binding protein Rrp42 (RNase PH superfamily)